MLSSDDFFANSPAGKPSDPKRARTTTGVVKAECESEDDILALLDEIDAVTAATCDTMVTASNLNDQMPTDPFNGHSLVVDLHVAPDEGVTMKELNARIDNDYHDDHNNASINNNNNYNRNGYLPKPFTAEADNLWQVMADNVRLLSVNNNATTNAIDTVDLGKVETICGFVVDYERVGSNFKVALMLCSNQTVMATFQGAIFDGRPCHYGMLFVLQQVTCFQGHCIVTVRNVVNCWLNHHIIQ